MLIAIGLLLCFARVESKLRQNIANDEAHGKTYPGFTIFDADGQFAKAIGRFLCNSANMNDSRPT